MLEYVRYVGYIRAISRRAVGCHWEMERRRQQTGLEGGGIDEG